MGALFLPGELERPGSHAVYDDVHRVRPKLYRHRGELGALADTIGFARENSKTGRVAVTYLALLVCLPRPKGRPLGPGLQAPRKKLAAWLGCSLSTFDRARAILERRGLIQHYARTEAVERITAARRRPLERFEHVSGDDVAHVHTSASVCSTDYPSPRALTLLDVHTGRGRFAREGLWKTLWQLLKLRLRRFFIVQRGTDTPYKEGTAPFNALRRHHRSRGPGTCGQLCGAAVGRSSLSSAPNVDASSSPPTAGPSAGREGIAAAVPLVDVVRRLADKLSTSRPTRSRRPPS